MYKVCIFLSNLRIGALLWSIAFSPSNVYFIYFSFAHFLATSLKQLVSLNMHGVCCLTVYSNQLQLLLGSMPLLTIYIYTLISSIPSSLHGITSRNRHTIFSFLEIRHPQIKFPKFTQLTKGSQDVLNSNPVLLPYWIHSFSKYLMSFLYMQEPVLGAGNTHGSEIEPSLTEPVSIRRNQLIIE